MGIALAERLGRGEIERAEQPSIQLSASRRSMVPWRMGPSITCAPIRMAGFEGVGRTLRDIGDAGAAHALAHRAPAGHQVLAPDRDLAGGDAAAAAARSRARRDRWSTSGARLPDQAHYLAALEGQVDPVHQHGAARRFDTQALICQNRVAHRPSP